ncbi:MAG TPA: acyltransferase [Gammaproteobacteria bacterium]|nr:acyltransferase [Gammaproteobacteria bacterium]
MSTPSSERHASHRYALASLHVERKAKVPAAPRLGWVDYAKGLTIFLVVYGHTLNSTVHAGFAPLGGFHTLSEDMFSNLIPLFFFLSGLFVARSFDKRGAQEFLLRGVSRLAYPYFIWSLLQAAAEIAFSAESHHGTTYATLLAIPYLPLEQFWFLYTLLLMYPAYVLARRFGRFSSAVLAAAAAVLFWLPIRIHALTLDQFSIHLIFFAAGVLLRPWFVGSRVLRLPPWSGPALTAGFLAYALYLLSHELDPATALTTHVLHRYYYVSLAVLAGAAVIGWAQLLEDRGWLQMVRLLGEYSLQIYVAHMFFAAAVRIAVEKLLGPGDPYLILVGGIAAGIAGPIALCVSMRRLGLPNLFSPPHLARAGLGRAS